jgi:hypothetical protein
MTILAAFFVLGMNITLLRKEIFSMIANMISLLIVIYHRKDSNLWMIDMDIDSDIIAYLKEKGVCRTTQLVKDIRGKYRHKGGIGEATIYRAIDRLKGAKNIYSPSDEEVESFGIKIGDGRSKFLILRTFMERKEHLDDVFLSLNSKDRNEKLRGLREILLYKDKQQFTPKQLDIIADFLGRDIFFVKSALEILYDYFMEKGITPSNEAQFIVNLRDTLLKFRDKSDRTIIKPIIEILGIYEDDVVINQLKYDAEKDFDIFKKISPEYESIFLAKVIENNRKSLYNFNKYLINEDKSKNATIIDHIRETSLKNIEYFKPPVNIKTASEILREGN